jgi:hypothetical protein
LSVFYLGNYWGCATSDATCDSIGGVTKFILVPIAITVMPKEYCFPKAIADYWDSCPAKS